VTWAAICATSAACYGLKLAGWSLPPRLLEHERLQRFAAQLPFALLGAAGVAVLLRAPFIVVLVVAAATAAAVRALT
jgi:hypothetical protein